jgi:hypothetical protein
MTNQEEWQTTDTPREQLIAKLTQAAYNVALRHTAAVPFTDLELALWRELRKVFDAEARAGDAA